MKCLNRSGSFLLVLCAAVFFAGCRPDAPVTDLDSELDAALRAASGGSGRAHYILPDEGDYSAIPQDPNNSLTREKVELGRLLFHESVIGTNPRVSSGSGTYSCSSCHHAAGGFQACRKQGIGEGGVGFGVTGEGRNPSTFYPIDSIDVQPIRTPSAMNSAYQEITLWNGQFGGTGMNIGTEANWTVGTPKEANNLGYQGVETQAIAGLKVHRMVINTDLKTVAPDYGPLFEAAFPNLTETERFTREYAGLAIAAYERTLLANRAPFQRWLRGEHSALSDQEKNGGILFFGKAGCSSCHNGPALASMEFYGLGMGDLDGSGIYGDDPGDGAKKGRGGFTGRAEDLFKFKVPQLYNLKDSPFYGHGGTFSSIESVIRYKNAAVVQKTSVPASQLASEFQPLNLSDQEIKDIAAFLDRGLYDGSLFRYVPSSIPSGNCFPNNDPNSRYDLGCN